MAKEHHYKIDMIWTGNLGEGTKTYRGYERSHEYRIAGKPVLAGSSDPAFRGDPSKHNPEDLMVCSLSSCHMLTYLHLCALAGVVVIAYEDHATGTMAELPNNGGHFTEVVLHPVVTVTDVSMIEKANSLHHQANELCFVAASVNFPVKHEPICKAAE